MQSKTARPHKKVNRTFLLAFLGLFALLHQGKVHAQLPGNVNGNIVMDGQYYLPDSAIGAEQLPQETGINAYGDIQWRKGDFSAGLRYEAYQPPLLGYDKRFEGNGIPYRFARYRGDLVDVTLGNFYEQFGSGMIFRTYEEKGLGLDNSLDGIRVRSRPVEAVQIKGVYGKQRNYWDKSPGLVRGVDGELYVNSLHDSLKNAKTQLTLGGSFVSKYQEDQNRSYNLPENVSAWSGRFQVFHGMFSLKGEYVRKMNDPSADNNFSYKEGQGLYLNANYARSGFGASLGAKSIDNMSFRSDRYASVNDLQINYLPALTEQHTYNLAATLYPYATQPNGETAIMGEFYYRFDEGTLLGGEKGMEVSVNYSAVNSPDTTHIDGPDAQRELYRTRFFEPGDEIYFRDLNMEIEKEWSDRFKSNYSFFNIAYNMDVVQGLEGKGMIHADIHVLDLSYQLNDDHNIRMELQSLFTDDHQGDWATGLIEYSVSPHWSFTVMDQYNFGNDDPEQRLHYLFGNIGYIQGGTRVSVGYGRQRAGIFCVGGVCRNVPASNGFRLSLSSSF